MAASTSKSTVILAFSVIAAGNVTKPDAVPRSIITYAISVIGCMTACAIVIEKYYITFLDLDFQDYLSLATWTNDLWGTAAPTVLILVLLRAWYKINSARKSSAKEMRRTLKI